MTVVNTNTSSGPLSGNGVTTVFPFDFHAASIEEISVTLNGIDVPKNLYTASILGDAEGSVTFFAAPLGEVYIFSDPEFTQSTNFEDQGPYFQSSLNDPLDRSSIRDLWLRDKVLRSFALPLPGASLDAVIGKFPVVLPNGMPGWSFGTGVDAGFRGDIASTRGAAFMGYQNRTVEDRLGDSVALEDHLLPQYMNDRQAVSDAIQEAILRANGRSRHITINTPGIYAQPADQAILNNIVISAPRLTRPSYSGGVVDSVMFEQIDEARAVFRLGRNVTLSGINMRTRSLTNANANAVIAAAGATTRDQRRIALEARWGATAPLLMGQPGDAMEFITLEDITVPYCWKFARYGDVGQYQSAGAINLIRPRVYSVSIDFELFQSAETHHCSQGFFSFGVSPDLFVNTNSPLSEYTASSGAFAAVTSGASFRPSFDGFDVSETLVFGKRIGLYAASGRLDVSTWKDVYMDGVVSPIYQGLAGRIVNTDIEIAGYAYQFPIEAADPDASTKAAIDLEATVADSQGPSFFSLTLHGKLSASSAIRIRGDQTLLLNLPDAELANYGAAGASPTIAAIDISNPNAVVRAPGAIFDGNGSHVGITLAGGTFESDGPSFRGNINSVTQSGGILHLDSPKSVGTSAIDITRTGGTWDVRSPRWSKPLGNSGVVRFKATGGAAQAFSSTTPVVKLYTSVYDNHKDFGTNAFVAPDPDNYAFSASVTHDATGTAGDSWIVAICVNGTAQASSVYKMIADVDTVSVYLETDLLAGDVVDVRISRRSGSGSFTTINDNSANIFMGRRND